MDDNENENSYSDIVRPTTPIDWQQKFKDEYELKQSETIGTNMMKIFGMMMGMDQCACTHKRDSHGAPDSGALTLAKLQAAVDSLKEIYRPKACQVCSCMEFETDNLEWLLKRDKWRKK